MIIHESPVIKMREFHLDNTYSNLQGPSEALMTVCNQWAAVALDKFHANSSTIVEFVIHGKSEKILLKWDSNFSKAAMKERKDMANHGGVAMAWFIMSVLLEYKYVEQSEIGEGVDYRFKLQEPDEDDLNFIDDSHYVEISGILEESPTNTLKGRIKKKHGQIDNGSKSTEKSSVVVTLFSEPTSVKEIHNEG